MFLRILYLILAVNISLVYKVEADILFDESGVKVEIPRLFDETKLLNKNDSMRQKEWLEMTRKKISKHLMPAKADYTDFLHRGTVYFNRELSLSFLLGETSKVGNHFIHKNTINYAYHKVIIPDGTYVSNANFTQAEPFTNAIEGKNIVFEDCNLMNVVIDPSWVVVGGIQLHKRDVIKTENGENYEVHEKCTGIPSNYTSVEYSRELITQE